MPETVHIKIVATLELEIPYDEKHYQRFADEGGGLMSKDEIIEFEKEQAIETLLSANDENVTVTTTVTFQADKKAAEHDWYWPNLNAGKRSFMQCRKCELWNTESVKSEPCGEHKDLRAYLDELEAERRFQDEPNGAEEK